MKKVAKLVLQKLLLVSVGVVCTLTVLPFVLAVVDSLVSGTGVSDPSILKTYIGKLFSKELV